jgi:predicted CoA-binding protein
MPGLGGLPGIPDIVCMYVRPAIGLDMLDQIVATGSRVLWLNPGSEDAALVAAAEARGLRVVQACTLVVLSWGDPLEVASPEALPHRPS